MLHYADEVVSSQEARETFRKVAVEERDSKMAQQLIQAMSGGFDPSQYHDEYREAMQALIQRKAEGKEIVVQPQLEEVKGEVINLTAALRASLAKRKQPEEKKPARPRATRKKAA